MIGIVGGVGPLAGLDLNRKIVENTVATCDQQHLPVLLASFSATIPDRTEYLHSLKNDRQAKQNPGHSIAKVVRLLTQAGASTIGVPCNTAHAKPIWEVITACIEQDKSLAKIKLVNMVEETLQHVASMGFSKIGLMATLGTYFANTYTAYAAEKGIEIINPNKDGRQELQESIYNKRWGVKGNCAISDKARSTMLAIAKQLQAKGAQAIIMGCTEIPLALEVHKISIATIDPTTVLARALVLAQCPNKLTPSTNSIDGKGLSRSKPLP